MKLFTTLIVLAVLFAGFVVYQKSNDANREKGSRAKKSSVIVYKTATCGCCGNFATYLQRNGYDVEIVNYKKDEELSQKKRELGVPSKLDSCHTTVFKAEKYFVEGHIPIEATEKLLAEKPSIKGIGMPGMPSASPGMPGAKTEPFNVSQVDFDDKITPYVTL